MLDDKCHITANILITYLRCKEIKLLPNVCPSAQRPLDYWPFESFDYESKIECLCYHFHDLYPMLILVMLIIEDPTVTVKCKTTQKDPTVTEKCKTTQEDPTVTMKCKTTQEDPTVTVKCKTTQEDPTVTVKCKTTQEDPTVTVKCKTTQ